MNELKIIMRYDDGKPITSTNTVIYINDKPIGCIQNIKTEIDAGNYVPKIEITFPNLKSERISDSYKSPFIKEIDGQIDELSKIPNVKIVLKDII